MSAVTKIPVIGLGNAGKTSLIKTLNNEFKQLSKLKPTKGIERSIIKFLDKEISVWDFGGQDKYREGYMKKADAYFADISHLYYVVDIQDRILFNDSILYFKELLESIKPISPHCHLHILFNKADPGIDEALINEAATLLEQRFSELASGFKIKFYKTTILNPLSVITAFSRELFGNIILYDNFSKSFEEYCNEMNLDFILVMTKDLKEIGHYISKNVDATELRKISNSIFESFEKNKMKITDVNAENDRFYIRLIGFQAGKDNFYFVYGFSNDKKDQADRLIKSGEQVLVDVRKLMKYW